MDYKERSELYRQEVDLSNKDDPRKHFVDWLEKDGNIRILDVGCACGDLIYTAVREKGVQAWGMEFNQDSIYIAKSRGGEDIFQVDLNNFKAEAFPQFYSFFDYIIFGDVLEHVMYPEEALEEFKKLLKPSGYFLISLPNIAHADIKANLLLDNFEYEEAGLLDRTHFRFFTYKSIARFLAYLGIRVDDYKCTSWAGGEWNRLNPFPELPCCVKRFICRDAHSFISQYVMKCKVCTEDNMRLFKNNINILNREKKVYPPVWNDLGLPERWLGGLIVRRKKERKTVYKVLGLFKITLKRKTT